MAIKTEVSMLVDWRIPFGALISSLLLTPLIRYLAVKRHLVDVPNARSSHEQPTPRGGGVAVFISYITALIFFFFAHYVPFYLTVAFVGAGFLVAAVSFWDDHSHVSPQWRIVVHFVAAIWAWFFISGATINPHLSITGWFFNLFLIVSIVWVLNLYNFMDGIDAIAGAEAIFIGGSAALLFGISNSPVLTTLSVLLVASTAGFLIWNLPPARIFLGDVGSGFLGIIIALLALVSIKTEIINVWTWLILLGVFLVDATLTVVRRMLSGLKWYGAHRSHAYQHLAVKWKSHGKVTLALTGINLFWLFPWAVVAYWWQNLGILCVIISYIPLICLDFLLGAGRDDLTHLDDICFKAYPERSIITK